ncbi:MAG: hypothetical protein M3238_00845 [Actinomycetota bacterium]|nr:hypothetical protein [Actinomycetota bacterium]
MRKVIAVIALAGLVAVLGAAPATAAKAKKVHGTFGATLAPFPKLAAWGDPVGLTKPGCSSGQEGVHWVGQEFTAPGKGTLRVWAEGFTGDHDIYIFKGDVPVARGEEAQVNATDPVNAAPPEEEITFPLKKGDKVLLVACNWLGEPEVEAHYMRTFK